MRYQKRMMGGMRVAIDSALAQNHLAETLRPHRGIVLWAEVVGEAVAQASTAESVRNGVLFVRARSSPWAHELTLMKTDILNRLNAKLGGQVLTDIHFKAGGRRPKALVDLNPSTLPAERPTEREIGSKPLSAEASFYEQVEAIRARASRTLDWKRAHGWTACQHCQSLFLPESLPNRGRPVSIRFCSLCRLKEI